MLGVTQAVEATCGVSHQGLIENILPLGWGVVLTAMPDNPSSIPGAQMESGETPNSHESSWHKGLHLLLFK